MTSKAQKILFGGLGIVIGLPVLLTLTAFACFWMLDKTNGTIVSSSVTRRYLLYVPRTYNPPQPTPLVISFHPAARWPAVEKTISGWNDLADKYAFIVVYPAGSGAFHGTADKLAPYHGGTSPIAPRPFANIPEWTARLAQRNQCRGDSIDTRVAPHVRRLAYTNCVANGEVILYAIEGGGPTWPGVSPAPEWWAGRTTDEINATNVMWQFFIEHPRAPK